MLSPYSSSPLILGIFLLISLPSMVIAWIKLRQRTLGPATPHDTSAVTMRATSRVARRRHAAARPQ